jgi:D-glycero-D-manno-heptose 1,7-bisphosphate phosphatase
MIAKLIILDRDGVINHDSDAYIKSPEEWIPIDGSLEAIARLTRGGYTVTVASNQSGISRGYFDLQTLAAMHRKMDELLVPLGGRVEAVFFCPHSPRDKCACRKPQPGLLNEISQRFSMPLDDVLFVGDTINDVNCALNAGARPVLVKTGKGERATLEKDSKGFADVPVFADLAEVVDALLDAEQDL